MTERFEFIDAEYAAYQESEQVYVPSIVWVASAIGKYHVNCDDVPDGVNGSSPVPSWALDGRLPFTSHSTDAAGVVVVTLNPSELPEVTDWLEPGQLLVVLRQLTAGPCAARA